MRNNHLLNKQVKSNLKYHPLWQLLKNAKPSNRSKSEEKYQSYFEVYDCGQNKRRRRAEAFPLRYRVKRQASPWTPRPG